MIYSCRLLRLPRTASPRQMSTTPRIEQQASLKEKPGCGGCPFSFLFFFFLMSLSLLPSPPPSVCRIQVRLKKALDPEQPRVAAQETRWASLWEGDAPGGSSWSLPWVSLHPRLELHPLEAFPGGWRQVMRNWAAWSQEGRGPGEGTNILTLGGKRGSLTSQRCH
jgi:hypothetical protein